MKTKVLLSILFVLLLAPQFEVQGKSFDASDLAMLKDYFSSHQTEQLGDDDDDDGEHKEGLKDFVVMPDNPRASATTDYKLEFTVSKKAYPRVLGGYFVFFFPNGFDLSELDAASIQTNTFTEGFITNVSVEGQFAILDYSVLYTDSVYKPLPERIKFTVTLRAIKNHAQEGKYRIAGAAIKNHNFVAGPSWSEKFEITETSNEDKSELQIISTEIVAPNAPKVNTGQVFEIHSLIVNRGNTAVNRINFRISSDGNSTFGNVGAITNLEPGDTLLAKLHVTAADEPNIAETFQISFDTTRIIEIPAIDNRATAILQTPALLELTSNIEDNSTVNLESNQTLNMTFELLNHGQARVSTGQYTLTLIGTEINSDTVTHTGEIIVGTPLEFQYESTNSGRVVIVNFTVDEFPIDSNNLQPALFMDSEIEFVIIEGPVHPSNPDDSFIVEVNPYDPDDGPEIFRYNLPKDMQIDFKIFTLIGEEVYSKSYDAGNNGGRAGQNNIQWDGRNDGGLMVLNGAYVAMVISRFSDFKLSLKLAVLK